MNFILSKFKIYKYQTLGFDSICIVIKIRLLFLYTGGSKQILIRKNMPFMNYKMCLIIIEAKGKGRGRQPLLRLHMQAAAECGLD